MSENKLPDPPAYDPRVEAADAAEIMLTHRASIVEDLAINEGNGFLCALVLRHLVNDAKARSHIETACRNAAFDLSVDGISKFVPHDVRNALGLE